MLQKMDLTVKVAYFCGLLKGTTHSLTAQKGKFSAIVYGLCMHAVTDPVVLDWMGGD